MLALSGRELGMAVVEDVSFARGLERAVIRTPTHEMMEEERGEVGEAWVSKHNGGTTTMSKEGEEEDGKKKEKNKNEWRFKICSPEIKAPSFFPL